MTLRRTIRAAASTRPVEWAVSALERLDRGRADVLAVLTYHRIAEPAVAGMHAALYVSPSDFEEQLDVLKRRYAIVSADDVLDARHGRRPLPRHALLLTFDDAYTDFGATAWPRLRERSLPALLFVPTSYPDQPHRWFWWDRLGELLGRALSAASFATPLGELPVGTPQERERTYRLLRDHCKRIGVDAACDLVEGLAGELDPSPARNEVLGWDALRQLAAEGVAIAPHSRTHPLLPTLSDELMRDELTGSCADIERELGSSVSCFAYPSGAWDQRVVEATAAAGLDVAFTTRRGVNDLRKGEWLTMRRVNVGPRADSTLLRAQVGRWMTLADRR